MCDDTSTMYDLVECELYTCMTGLYTGKGPSALVPVVVALGQGVRKTERKPVKSITNITIFHTEQTFFSSQFPHSRIYQSSLPNHSKYFCALMDTTFPVYIIVLATASPNAPLLDAIRGPFLMCVHVQMYIAC